MLGVLLVDKPQGWTSHDVVARLRKILGTKRIGHAGTLDPMATGLLVLGVGAATRFLQYMSLEPKEYRGEITLGASTNTMDAEGELTSENSATHLDTSDIVAAAQELTGEILQVPPMYSAIKIRGERLYKLARKGIEIEREPRRVAVHEFQIESTRQEAQKVAAVVRVVCGGGTYVRRLASDLGEKLGVGGYLSSLRRTRVGRFTIKDARFGETELQAGEPPQLISLEEALAPMKTLRIPAHQVKTARNGGEIALPVESELAALMDESGVFAIARKNGDVYRPLCVVPESASD